MTPYDPEAAVADIENLRFERWEGEDFLMGSPDFGLYRQKELDDIAVALKHPWTKAWLRAALAEAHRAGEREAWNAVADVLKMDYADHRAALGEYARLNTDLPPNAPTITSSQTREIDQLKVAPNAPGGTGLR